MIFFFKGFLGFYGIEGEFEGKVEIEVMMIFDIFWVFFMFLVLLCVVWIVFIYLVY